MLRNIFHKTKLALAFFVIISFILINLPQVNTTVFAQTEKPVYEQTATVEAKQLDTRAQILHNYLESKNSPLANYSQDFIDAADQNGVDWKLVPAISGVESTFGQAEPAGSFNAWGVGGSNLVYYKSWSEAIFTLNSYLKQNYINRGLTNPYSINRVYAASPTWGSRVSANMAELDQYAKKYDAQVQNSELANVLTLTKSQPSPSSAPLPAALALK